jgi:hypothetical protein
MTTKTKATRNTVTNNPTPEGIETMEKLISDITAPLAAPVEAPVRITLNSPAAPLAIVSDWTPPANARKGKSERYPFSVLEVGQSFMVPDRTAANFYGTAYSASTRLKVKLSVHDVPDGVMVHRSA